MDQAQQLQEQAEQIAKEYFGYAQLQPGQQEALAEVLQGRDTLVMMPTGAGKSAIYQIAGALLPGATVVVSPLIALQQDQVEALAELEIAARQAAEAVQRMQERHSQFDQSRLAMIRGYAELRDCRRAYLLNYFGEPYSGPCGCCDNCQSGLVAPDLGEMPFALNSRVAHAKWGEGAVMRYAGEEITVLFDEVGYKTLALEVVLEAELLKGIG